jgi:hypothetical protein
MTLHYLRHVFWFDPCVPHVVGVDKHDRTLLVAAGAGVAEHGGRGYAAPVHLFPESVEQLAATFGAAAPLAWCGAHEDLAQSPHAQILFRSLDKSSIGIRFQATGFRCL